MLDLEKPRRAAGLEGFGDHRDPAIFHYLPGAPVLLPGRTSLLAFRGATADGGESVSGGLLSLTVRCGPDDEQLAAAEEELGDGATLVPVGFSAGTARLILPGSPDGAVVLREIGASRPTLLGRVLASFSASLDAEAVVAVKASLEAGGTSVLAAALELQFEGLGPARHLRIEMDLSQSYSIVHARAAVTSLWLKADVASAIEALRKDGHIRVTDLIPEAQDAAARAERRAEIQALIVKLGSELFWQPVQSTEVASVGGGGRPALVNAGLRLRSGQQEQERTIAYDLDQVGVRERSAAPQAALALEEGAALDSWYTEVDPGAGPAPRAFVVQTAPGADWSGVAAVVVDARVGDSLGSLRLGPDEGAGTLQLPSGALEWRHRTLLTEGGDGAVEGDWSPTEQWSHVLDPQVLAGRRSLQLLLGPPIPGLSLSAEVRAGSDVVRLDGDAPEASLPVPEDGTLHADLRVDFEDGGEDVPWERSVRPGERRVVINPPAARLRTIRAALVDPLGRYERVHVELERDDGAHHRGLTLTAAEPEGTWATLLGEGGHRVRWRSTVALGGEVVEAPWRELDGGLLLVGDVGLRVRTVIVELLGDPHYGGVLTATPLDAPAGFDQPVEVLLDEGQLSAELRVPMSAGTPGAVALAGSVWADAGEILLGPLESTDAVVLIDLAPPG